MIKYESIISSFDDKDTLYNWLRKVEEQLKNASATGFVVNKKGNATLSFSITFANGETLESGDIVLQQGESVDDARIASGILQLHLTNGTWLTAGNIKPVSYFDINESQHLIVHYQDGTSDDLGAIFNGNITISGNLTATGTIDGNKVTGNEIVEKMVGYDFYPDTIANVTFEQIYFGIVKNGNKLTIAHAFNITTAEGVGFSGGSGYMSIPSAVGTKLFPTRIGGYDYLDAKVVQASDSASSSIPIHVSIAKNSDTNLGMFIYDLTSLTAGTKYYVRVEYTFLLSDNLAE